MLLVSCRSVLDMFKTRQCNVPVTGFGTCRFFGAKIGSFAEAMCNWEFVKVKVNMYTELIWASPRCCMHLKEVKKKKKKHIFPSTYLFTASIQSIHSPCLICWECFLANNLLGVYNANSRSQGFSI